MKLSTKIFYVLGLLMVLVIAVLALGLYGMSKTSSAIDHYMRVSNRMDALDDVRTTAFKFSLAEKDLILATETTVMQAVADSDEFKNFKPKIESQIERVRSTITPDSAEWSLLVPDQLHKAVKEFYDATQVAAEVACRNTNEKALDEYRANLLIWSEYLAIAEPMLADVLREWDEGQGNPEELNYALTLRINRISFQRDIQHVLTATGDEERRAAIVNLHRQTDEFSALLKKAPDIFRGKKAEVGRALYSQQANVTRIQGSLERLIEFAVQDSEMEAFILSTTTVSRAREAFEKVIEDAIAKCSTQLAGLSESTFQLTERLFWIMLVGSVLGMAIVGLIAYCIVSALTKDLNRIISVLDGGAQQVASAAVQINQASRGLAEGSTEQAASLEETSSALEQMASMTRQNADNATKTSDTMINARKMVQEGSDQMGNMASAMAEISDSAEKISRIIKTIEDIAFQTNLLALNAAVEAARAGEAGKGFAVVADEVRNLAQRSAQAARDTTALIKNTIENVQNGAAVTEKLGSSFAMIQEETSSVTTHIQEITAATNEQAQGVDQVNTAVAQMDKVTQQTAASADESASASEDLSTQATTLENTVNHLVALVMGVHRPEADAPGLDVTEKVRVDSRPRRQPRTPPSKVTLALPMQQNYGAPLRPASIIPLDNDFDGF